MGSSIFAQIIHAALKFLTMITLRSHIKFKASEYWQLKIQHKHHDAPVLPQMHVWLQNYVVSYRCTIPASTRWIISLCLWLLMSGEVEEYCLWACWQVRFLKDNGAEGETRPSIRSMVISVRRRRLGKREQVQVLVFLPTPKSGPNSLNFPKSHFTWI